MVGCGGVGDVVGGGGVGGGCRGKWRVRGGGRRRGLCEGLGGVTLPHPPCFETMCR